MELRVVVDGIERCVSGVKEDTTCYDIIEALARSLHEQGAFELIERYRNIERRLPSTERPLEILRRKQGHAMEVKFEMIRVLKTENASSSYDNLPNTSSADKLNNRANLVCFKSQPSNSSIASASAAMVQPNISFPPSGRSSASLPGYQGTLPRNRPPPPDYRTVMEQKFASLSRGSQSRSGIPNVFTDQNKPTTLSHNDLVILVEKQRQIIEKQKESLYNSEVLLPGEPERELLQLEMQQLNLRTVLEPLRTQNWPQQYQTEVKTSHRLRATIEATREALDKIEKDKQLILAEEKNLMEELAHLEESSYEMDVSLSNLNLNDSPQKLRAC